MPPHPCNELARRLYAALLSHQTGEAYPVALRRTPLLMPQPWLDWAERLAREAADRMAAALLSPAALFATPPASPLKH